MYEYYTSRLFRKIFISHTAKNNLSDYIFGIDIRHHIIILDLYFNAVKYNEYKYLFLFTI